MHHAGESDQGGPQDFTRRERLLVTGDPRRMAVGKTLTQADFATAAAGLSRLLEIISAGEMTASAATIARLEGAVIALEAASSGRLPHSAELLGNDSLHERDV